jgi:hypothetical protein
MHGLILISYTEYRTLFLFEGLDPTSNRLIHFSRENWWRSMNLIYVYTVDNQDFQGILKVYYVGLDAYNRN